jgi:serine/threonine protein kinase
MRDRIKLTGEAIDQIIKDTLSALVYLQQKKVMHRDLKP